MEISFGKSLDVTEYIQYHRTFFIFTLQNDISPWGNSVKVEVRSSLGDDFFEILGHPNDFGFSVSLNLQSRTKFPFQLKIIVTDINLEEHTFEVVSRGFISDPSTIDIQDALR